MYILSPKTDFLGGALVSASHLGRLFPGRLLTWKDESSFLDVNKVEYKVVGPDTTENTLRVLKEHDLLKEPLFGFFSNSKIWCNDTCVDGGYFPEYEEENMELFKFLSNFDEINFLNHQPVNRYYDYLIKMLNYLVNEHSCKVNIWNYRAGWTTEFNNELAGLFPSVGCYTAPYHYYLPQVPKLDVEKIPNSVASIGRSNSKCKIQYKLNEIEENLYDLNLTQLLPDSTINNSEFLQVLKEFEFTLTGYYYGQEGNPEMTEYYNKLEWSVLDSLLVGTIPLTNTLFSKELERLNIPLPMIGYLDFEGYEEIEPLLGECDLLDSKVMERCIDTITEELRKGNRLMDKIINGLGISGD